MDGEQPHIGMPDVGVGDLPELETEGPLDEVEHAGQDAIEREVARHFERIDSVIGATLLGVVEPPIPGLDHILTDVLGE
jgi:hypothetical protein